MTWKICTRFNFANFGLALIIFGAVGIFFCQDSDGQDSTKSSQPQLKGKVVFEQHCATCHGLDGLGGEHAPDIIRRSAVKTLSDEALLELIHDGIPEVGMPGFPSIGKDASQAIVAYLRILQGKSSSNSTARDPVHGRDLFFGKAGCSTCHSRGQSISESLSDFARDHEAGEIAEAIVKPTSGRNDGATAVALDGRKFSGMIRNEDNASLQLQDEDGRFYLLMKSSLASLQRKSGEAMPADYGQRLSATEIDDLVGYILREAHASDVQSAPTETETMPYAQH